MSTTLALGSLGGEAVYWDTADAQHMLIMGALGDGKTVVCDHLAKHAAGGGWKVFYYRSVDFTSVQEGFEDFYRITLEEVEARPDQQFLVILDGGEGLLQMTGGLHPSNIILSSLLDEDLPNLHVVLTMQSFGLLQEDVFAAKVFVGEDYLWRMRAFQDLPSAPAVLEARDTLYPLPLRRHGAVAVTARGAQAFVAKLG